MRPDFMSDLPKQFRVYPAYQQVYRMEGSVTESGARDPLSVLSCNLTVTSIRVKKGRELGPGK